MAIESTPSDTSRAIQHDPDQSWPEVVKLELSWFIDGVIRSRTMIVQADAFFGRGNFGAPMSGDQLINTIERMRRDGPPPALPRQDKKNVKKALPERNGRGKKSVKRSR